MNKFMDVHRQVPLCGLFTETQIYTLLHSLWTTTLFMLYPFTWCTDYKNEPGYLKLDNTYLNELTENPLEGAHLTLHGLETSNWK